MEAIPFGKMSVLASCTSPVDSGINDTAQCIIDDTEIVHSARTLIDRRRSNVKHQ